MHALSAGTRLPPPPHTHTEHGDESTLFSLGGEGGGGGGGGERERDWTTFYLLGRKVLIMHGHPEFIS